MTARTILLTIAGIAMLAACSGPATDGPHPQTTVTVTATHVSEPNDEPTPTPTATVTKPSDDELGDENLDSTTVDTLEGKVGIPLLVTDPEDPKNTATINVFRVDRVVSDDPDSYDKPEEAKGFLSVSVTVRVKTGSWEVDDTDWTLEPDADTGVPQYTAYGSVGRYDSHGNDRALYTGKVKAGKHVEGGVYFDAPTGTKYTLRYAPTLYFMIDTTDDGLAKWRIPDR